MALADAAADPGPEPAAETALPEPGAAAGTPGLRVATGESKVVLTGGGG